MSNIKNLSEEFIELKDLFSHKNELSFDEISKDEFWNECKGWRFYRHVNWKYFQVIPNAKEKLIVGSGEGCQLRKIMNGYLKGCFVVIEQELSSQGSVKLSVFGDNGILKFPEFKKHLTIEQIDSVLDDKNIEMMTAVILNKFDPCKKIQDYELFCDRLPSNCLRSGVFKGRVALNFNALGKMDIENVEDVRAINLDYCKNKTIGYFNHLTTSAEKILK